MSRGDVEVHDLIHLSLREEPIGDSALIEDLDGARVQTACARADEVLAGAPLDNGNVDARQRQLARQHQPCRTSSGDHHRMLGHRHAHFVTPFRRFRRRPAILRHAPGLTASPPVRYSLKVSGSGYSFPFLVTHPDSRDHQHRHLRRQDSAIPRALARAPRFAAGHRGHESIPRSARPRLR